MLKKEEETIPNNRKQTFFKETLGPRWYTKCFKHYVSLSDSNTIFNLTSKMTIPFFYQFFLKLRKQIITLRNEEGHQLTIKHSENI